MARSSYDPSSLSSDEYYMTTPIQDDVSSDDLRRPSVEETRGEEAQIRGHGSIDNETLEGDFRTRGELRTRGGGARTRGGGVRTRGGGARTRGGLRMQGIPAMRCRRNNVTRTAFGISSAFEFTSIEDDDLSDNSFIPWAEEEEAAEEEGRRGRGQGSERGSGRGRGRGRMHEEEVEAAATMVTLRPGIGNSCATNSNERLGLGNSYATNSRERPEIGNFNAMNYNGVGSALVQLHINEGGTGSGNTEGATTENIAILNNTNMLDCRICLETLNIPVYQCVKGHISCSTCRDNHQNKCPTCCLPIDYIRNHGLEEVLKAVEITCPNSKYGCKGKVTYSMKREHMRSCTYEPCYCPLPGCGFDGSYRDLYLHFSSKHPASATRFTFDSSFSVHMGANIMYKFLQEDDRTLFILNYGVLTIGYVANIICVGPRCSENEYSYELEAAGSVHSSSKFTSLVPSLPKWMEDLPAKSGLLVQKVFIDSSWDHKIQVCIRKKGEN